MSVLQTLITKLGFEVDDHALEGMHHKLDRIGESVKIIAGIEVAKALFELSERFAGFAEHMESAAIQAGLTIEELQRLQFAATQNAVSADELNAGMAKLGRTLFQAQKGSKSAADAFARLGIDKGQLDSFATTEEALFAIQDGIGQLGSQQEKLAVVQQLFGRGGSKFLKFLQEGSERTKQLGKSADEMGAVISTQGIEALATFEDATASLGQVVKSFLATIAGTFAPAFTKAIRSIEQAWAHNREAISSGLEKIAYGFGYYFGLALVAFDEFQQSIHALIYRDTGIVGIVKGAFTSVWNFVSSVFNSIKGAIENANKDGTLTRAFEQVKGLIFDLADAVKSLIKDFHDLAAVFSSSTSIDLSKYELLANTFWGIGKAIEFVTSLLRGFAQIIGGLFSGGLGDATGQGPLGAFYDMQQRRLGKLSGALSKDGGIKNQVRYSLAGGEDTLNTFAQAQVSGAARFLGATDFARKFETPSNNEQMLRLSDAIKAPSTSPIYQIASPVVNVTASPGMSTEDLARLVVQKQAETLEQKLNEAQRDFTTQHVY